MGANMKKLTMNELLGNTPLVYLDTVNGNELYAKLEYYNPTGSIKDRAAYYMINKALENGEIDKNTVIIEPTSGNTGIGLAYIGRILGMRVILTLPENMSLERRQILSALGAELVLTPAADGMKGAIAKAEELKAEISNSYIPNQFSNKYNSLAHFETTAPEIFGAVQADYILDGVGSGGTLMGISDYIKANGKSTQIVAIEPSENTVLSNGVVGAHKIQGIGANFVPELVDIKKIDKFISITNEEAFEGAKEMALKYGVMCGISAGANYAATLKLSKEITNAKIVIIVPDNASKYLSMGIYG